MAKISSDNLKELNARVKNVLSSKTVYSKFLTSIQAVKRESKGSTYHEALKHYVSTYYPDKEIHKSVISFTNIFKF